jgi:alkanesulfonate monooxygenase SsuD/methylene tetrahydromethanopterin reductase-like flavin-dependent oxidoreductase (luciferase family)
VEPCAVQEKVPIWVGGRTLRSLRRAATLADGWMPFGLSTTDLQAMLARVDVPAGFETVLPAGPLDPLADPRRTTQRLTVLRDVGATAVTVTVSAESVDHYCDQLAALRDLADM